MSCNIVNKFLVGGLFVSVQIVATAAVPVDIVIGDTTHHCTHNEIKVLGNGTSVIQLNADSCDLGGTPIVDSDNDGYSDTVEEAEGTNPNDATSKPLDTDGDFQPDSTDLDDDNDGYTDAEEVAAGTDPLDSTSKPATPPPPSQGPLVHEPDFLEKYNGGKIPYSSKDDLNPIIIGGKKYFIVNPGLSSTTSLPSCVNGKSVQANCAPSGWSMGFKKNEIYALRYMTKSNYDTAKIELTNGELADGYLANADYKVTISKVPGEMSLANSFHGRCDLETSNAEGALYLTTPGNSPYADWGIYCEIPAGEEFYVNFELTDNSRDQCDSLLCGGVINGIGMKN